MKPEGETCTFVFDPGEWDGQYSADTNTLNLEYVLRDLNPRHDTDWTWRCPYDRHPGEERCVFHLPMGVKSERETIDEFVHQVSRARNRDDPHPRFLGAEFPNLDLVSSTLDAAGGRGEESGSRGVDLRCVHVEGDLRCERTTVRDDLLLGGTVVDGAVVFTNSTIEGDLDAQFSRFGSIALERGEVGGETTVSETPIGGDFRVKRTTFAGGVECGYSEVGGTVSFERAMFEDDVELNEARIGGGLQIERATVKGNAWLRSGTVDAVSLEDVTIDGDFVFGPAVERAATFRRMTSQGDAHFRGSVGGDALFDDLTVDGTTDVTASFGGLTSFEDVRLHLRLAPELTHPALDAVRIQDSIVRGGRFEQPSEGGLIYDVRETALGDVAIDTPADGSPFERVFLSNTTLNGFDFVGKRDELVAANWVLNPLSERALTAIARYEAFPASRAITEALASALMGDPREVLFLPRADSQPGDPLEYEEIECERLASDLADGTIPTEDVPASVDGVVFDVADFELMISQSKGPSFRYSHDHLSERSHRVLVEHARSDPLWIETDAEDGSPGSRGILSDAISSIDDAAIEGIRKLARTTLAPDGSPEKRETVMTELTTAIVDATCSLADQRPSAGELEALYLNAKNSANQCGDSPAAAEFFVREMRHRRRRHRATIGRGGRGLRWIGPYVANLTMGVTTGYGERPRRVVVVSLALAMFFAGIFAVTVPGEPLSRYVALSLNAFVLGGSDAVAGRLPALLVQVEGFLGAFFVGLFVFTLTRSVQR